MIVKMILTNGFDPDPRVYKEAKALVNRGYDVEILCWDRENRYIDKKSDIIDGIKIKRFFPKSQYGSGFHQIIGYIKFINELKNYLKDKKIDYIHCHDIDGAYVGTFLNNKSKFIWDMHELYDGFGYGRIKSIVYNYVAKKCYGVSNAIICVNNEQLRRYESVIKPNTKTEIISNAPEEEAFTNFKRTTSEKLRIAFIGSVRTFDTLKMLMDAGEKFEDVEIHINGIGTAYEKLKEIAVDYKNTILTGRYNYKDIKKFYEDADIIYAVYDKNLENMQMAFPVKGYEAVYTETPTIASKETFFGDFITKNDIGFAIEYNNLDELVKLISDINNNRQMLDEKSKNIKIIKKDYSWNSEVEKLIDLYKYL